MVALAIVCMPYLQNSHALSFLLAPDILGVILYCGTLLGRMGGDFSVLPRVWMILPGYRCGFEPAEKREQYELSLSSSAPVSNDEHGSNKGQSAVTFWIPASVVLCFSLEGG